MHGTAEIIEEAQMLPVEDRVRIVDSLLRTLNAPNRDIDAAWGTEAQGRLASVRDGSLLTKDGNTVFKEIKARYDQ